MIEDNVYPSRTSTANGGMRPPLNFEINGIGDEIKRNINNDPSIVWLMVSISQLAPGDHTWMDKKTAMDWIDGHLERSNLICNGSNFDRALRLLVSITEIEVFPANWEQGDRVFFRKRSPDRKQFKRAGT